MKKIIYSLLFVLLPIYSYANVVIQTTRIIYPEGNKEVTTQLRNNSSQDALVQSWLDDGDPDSTPETADVPFILTPPVAKIAGNGGQQLRIKLLDSNLPKDRESVFYLNTLDIPPLNESLQNQNVMQIAIRSRIKLFYRPANLPFSTSEIKSHVVLTKLDGNRVLVNNDTPYNLNLLKVKNNDKAQNILSEGLMISPYTKQDVNLQNTKLLNGKTVELTIINDFGADESMTVPIQ